MDTTIRKNEKCIIGMPRCDYVFSSTPSCFLAYGFKESKLEIEILKGILRNRGIMPEEAGDDLQPGKFSFCVKICSKIITSQFCIVIINNEFDGISKSPNANVNMEYGLMLGFNKYTIPFQKQEDDLPFNVATLDTVKYTAADFSDKAGKVIEKAIEDARPSTRGVGSTIMGEHVRLYLLSHGLIFCQLDNPADKELFNLGLPVGFNLLVNFSGEFYCYFGNFVFVNPATAAWRIRLLSDILGQRFSTLDMKMTMGMINQVQYAAAKMLMVNLESIVVVENGVVKDQIESILSGIDLSFKLDIVTMPDMMSVVKSLPGMDAQM